ncbi:MAG: ATP-binding protein [Vulcanimicrobiota bacterium]
MGDGVGWCQQRLLALWADFLATRGRNSQGGACASFLQFYDALDAAIEIRQLDPVETMANGDDLFGYCRLQGTTRQSGRAVDWRYAVRVRWRDGKIVAGHHFADYLALFRQLGVVPDDPRAPGRSGELMWPDPVHEALHRHEEERASLARDIHDGVAQDAAALWAFLSLEEAPNHRLREAADRMRLEAQRLNEHLSNPLELGQSLAEALTALASRHALESDLYLDLDIACDLAGSLRAVVYRVVQEAVQNVARHAGVNTVRVVLYERAGRLVGQVVDQGRGVGSRPPGFGIAGMLERCRLAGGTCEVQATPGGGTTVHFELPLEVR